MPCLEINLPRTDSITKEKLTARLTEALESNTRFEADIFGIRFHEYDVHQAGYTGKLYDGNKVRPYLHCFLAIPRIDRETKQKIVASFTGVFTDVFKDDSMKPVIHIHEYPYDNVGVDGQLLSDAFEECRKRKFYYELQDE